jgi:uncharacterized membrane protein
MTLAPLLQASSAIQLHAFAAMTSHWASCS